MDNPTGRIEDLPDEDEKMFSEFKNFEDKLRQIFRDPDAERIAAIAIQ